MSNFLMLRGSVPEDRPPEEIMHDSLEQEDDMWIHLFNGLLGDGDNGQVWYYDRKTCNPHYNNWYNDNLQILFETSPVSRANAFGHIYDLVFARGGFPYYKPILGNMPNAFKIYYGAGKRYIPKDGIKYDLILCDSERQKAEILKALPKSNPQLFIKPTVDHMFYTHEVEKEFDVCYVCGFPETKRKNMNWVWETCPKDLKVLQLGNMPNDKPPDNFTIKKVQRWEMAKEYSRCKIGIVPYTEEDSCPRVIPEMNACGLFVYCNNRVNWWNGVYRAVNVTERIFWDDIKIFLELRYPMFIYRKKYIAEFYKNKLSLPIASNYLKGLIK